MSDQTSIKVSILVPSYNGAKYLPDALNSALKQTYQDFEILIMDDGSTDNTKEVLAPFLEAHSDKIRYFYQENQGLACARNAAISHAQGEYLALLDADDIWLPQRLEKTVAVIEADPQVGLVHANITRISLEGKELDTPKRDVSVLSGSIFEHIFLRKAHVSCPTVLFRKKCYDDCGGFDPALARLGCEDRELWLRFVKKYSFQYIDEVLAFYRLSASSMSKNKEKMMKARMYVVDKFCPEGDQHCLALRKAALAKIYRDLGDEFLFEGNFDVAKENYMKAVRQNPFSFWLWVNFFKACLKVEVKNVS
ncbi:glycosyltransferase family 2 protein [Candidatus Omnitrophota bacterium]